METLTDGRTVYKVFLSQPMRNKPAQIIAKEREHLKEVAAEFVSGYLDPNGEAEIMESYFTDFREDANPVSYLAAALDMLGEADIVLFGKGWDGTRGCRIEHQVALDYQVDTQCICVVELVEGDRLRCTFNPLLQTLPQKQ